ncbi:hypothetical protein ACLUXI_08725 [Bifidobacterium apri]|uniref:hypothetical protein n=1 Tax=Bifidobacterium apri TaxID=1769423 RepID=UPI0039911954
MRQPTTFEIPSIGYTIVDNGTDSADLDTSQSKTTATVRRFILSTVAAIAIVAVGGFAATHIDEYMQERQWKSDITTDMATTVDAIDTLDLQHHGNIGFKDGDISCTDTRACYLNADADVVTTDPLDFGQKIPLHTGNSITIRHVTGDGHVANDYVVIGESIHFRGSCVYSSRSHETACSLEQ